MESHSSSRLLPSVGAYSVQCAYCFKWRLIPTKKKYEEIREHILENYFYCETAREWRPDISCDDPADINQDGSRLWAIDKPNIAQPPPGWERLIQIRSEGCTKFADVYYVTPSGKKLRSTVDVRRYLEQPEHVNQGVDISQFCFSIPKPLDDNYVRKRRAHPTASDDGNNPGTSRPLEPSEASSLAGPSSADMTDLVHQDPLLQLGGPGLAAPYFEAPIFDPVGRPSKIQVRRAPPKQT